MSNYLIKLLLVFQLFSTAQLFNSAQALGIFIAGAPNYSSIGAARIGWKDWEFGLATRSFYGVNKLFRFNKSFYSEFGVGLGAYASPGFYAGVGFDYRFASWIGLRGELVTQQLVNGHSDGHGLLGLSLQF